MKYEDEEKLFLKEYDSSIYEKLSITTDILIFSVSEEEKENYRKLNSKKFSILLIKRENFPFKGKWCLPGSFVNIDESLDDAAKRILANETNIHNIFIEQLYTFGGVNRDPRMRVISTAYMALIDKNRLEDKLPLNASWFNIELLENDNMVEVILDNGINKLHFKIKKILNEKTTDRYKFEIISNDGLAFDNPLAILSGIERLKNKLNYTDIVFNMMPEYFTLGELQQVYEIILGKKLLDPAFRRIIAKKVIKTDKVRNNGGHRPSQLFKYNNNN